MKVRLLHDHYDKDHLREVSILMKAIGPPTIRGFLMEDGIIQAIEGTHRILASKMNGVVPVIQLVYDCLDLCDVPLLDVIPLPDDVLICDLENYLGTVVEF